MIIAVDFDGTLSLGEWPDTGPANKPVIEALLERQRNGDKIILWTCRSGSELTAAVAWCRIYGLEFDSVNANLPEVLEEWGYQDTRKIFADEYWDDKSAPYMENPSGQMTDRELRAAATGILAYSYILQQGIPPEPGEDGTIELKGMVSDAAMEAALRFCAATNPDGTELVWYEESDEEDDDDDS